MKTLKTTLVVISTALLAIALMAMPSSGAIGTDDKPVSGSLNPWNDATSSAFSPAPTSFEVGEVVKLQANFSGGVRPVSLYKVGSTTPIATLQANSSGNAYFEYTVTSGSQQLFAEDTADLETETDNYTGIVPVPQTGVLDNPTSSGKSWKAHFTPGSNGRTTELQIQRTATIETDEVNPSNPDDDEEAWEGPWKTIATGKQNAAGDVSFTAPSPYPYRVAHNYRAKSGAATSNEVSYGLNQVTPKSTGLSAVYFNTNEGAAVDTRSRYFEGEFNMTSATKAPCSAVSSSTIPELKNSVMKGRGNYSWSFKRKSYTLKLGKKADLCGMGSNTKWALVSQDFDKSFMRNALAQDIGKKLNGLAWTPDSQPVDFYLNGKYQGNYMLVERISIDKDRVNVPELKAGSGKKDCKGVTQAQGQAVWAAHPNNTAPCVTGGYILEWDFRKGGDYDAEVGSGHWVGVKDPENDLNRENEVTDAGISSQQKTYIKSYLNEVDDVLRSSSISSSNNWKNYIDEKSAVDAYIANEFMKVVDGNMWASVYMYKQRDTVAGAKDGKLFFGPLWDFDLSSGSANRAGNAISPSGFYLRNNQNHDAMQPEGATNKPDTWFNRLNKNPSFKAAVAQRWDEVEPAIHITNFINAERAKIQASAEESFKSSPASYSYRIVGYQTIKGSWLKEVDNLWSWASAREKWLDGSSGF